MTGSLLSPAQLVGYVALVLGVAAFLQKSDTRLKVLISAESIAYVVHFCLLGNYPASGSALISCLRNLTSIRSRSPVWIAVYVALGLALGVCCAKSWLGWLPISASALATVAVFVLRGVFLRAVLLVCTLLWLVNNLLSGSVGGSVLEAIIALSNLVTICRMAAEHRQRADRAAAVAQAA